MFKNAKVDTPEGQGGSRPTIAGVRALGLLDRDHGGSERGGLGVLEIDPGHAYPPHRHGRAEEAMVVLEESGTFLTTAGSTAARQGALLFAPTGAWHAVQADDESLRVAAIFSGVGAAADAGWEQADGQGDVTDSGAAPVVLDMWDAPDYAYHDPVQGFFNLSARWLIDGDAGSQRLVLGQNTFAPGTGLHDLHRHPNADEFVLVFEGAGSDDILPDGERMPVGVGDAPLVPAGEWHGFHNTGAITSRTIFGYFGASSLDDGGYELPATRTPGRRP